MDLSSEDFLYTFLHAGKILIHHREKTCRENVTRAEQKIKDDNERWC